MRLFRSCRRVAVARNRWLTVHNPNRDTGAVLLGATALLAFLVLTYACILATPEYAKMFEHKTFFTDYLSGFGFMILLAAVGFFLVRRSQDQNERNE